VGGDSPKRHHGYLWVVNAFFFLQNPVCFVMCVEPLLQPDTTLKLFEI
jgi:hypothetical protein